MSDAPNAVVDQALKRYRLGIEAIQKQIDRETDDLKCQVPELMWPDDVKTSRAATTVAGVPLPPRPMISIPSLDQPVQLVLNQEKAAHLGIEIHALSSDADDDTAEIIQGLYRRIEVDSRASLARSWAYERAVKCGRGAYRILTEYANDGGHFTDQNIVIKRLLHQEAVVFDPFAQEPDWSDGRWAFVVSWMPWDTYQRKFPKSKLASYDDDGLAGLSVDCPDWIRGDDEARAVLTAEYFRLEFRTRRRVQFTDGTDGYDDEGKSIDTSIDGRDEEVPSLKWSVINAIEELDSEDRDGKYIPIIPVIGRELQPFDGERRWVGIYGPNKELARGLNYAASGLIESAALEPKAPFDIDPEEIEGYEDFWKQANVRNFPYLPRKKWLHGQPAGPLGRVQADASKLQMNALLLGEFRQFIHAGTGAFESALGEASPQNKTKGGILALQQQHDNANSHFLDNLAEITLTLEAKVILDLIPYYYDRPGRVARILDLEGNGKTVLLNQPFQMQGGKPVPVQAGQPSPDGAKHYDLAKGRYGVVVSIGKAYDRRAAEGADRLGQLFQAEPELFKILGDLYLKFSDFPGSQEAAERMKKMLPPELQDDAEQNAEAKAHQLAQENALLKQHLQELGGELAKDKLKADAQIQIGKDRALTTLEKTRMDNETKITVAELGAKVDRLQLFLEERARVGMQVHDAGLANAQQGHERDLAAQEHQHAMDQARAQSQRDAVLAEQGQQHTLEQGDQAQQGTLAAQQQAADLAPEPEAGA